MKIQPKSIGQFIAKRVASVLKQLNRPIQMLAEITRHKQAEEEQQEQLKRLSALELALNQAAIVATTDAQGRIIHVNDRFCEISQYSREELIGKTHQIINSGYHPKSFFQDLWQTISSGQLWRGEINNRAKDGTEYWVDTVIVPIFGDRGRPVQYMAIRFEITARKQAETSLLASEEQNRAILSTIPDLMIVIRADGSIVNLSRNQFVGELLQLDRNAFNCHIDNVLPPENAALCRHSIREALRTGEMQTHEQQLQFGDRIQYEEVRVVPYQNNSVLCLVRNISDRKQFEISLRQSEAKQRALIQALPDLIMRVSGEGVYLDFFKTPVFKVIGDKETLVGTRVGESLPPALAQQRMNAIQTALQTGELQIYEQELWVDGSLQTEECRVVVCGDNEALIIGRDITERKRAEAALQQLNEKLERRFQQRTQELRQSEQDLRTVFNNVYDAILIHDLDGFILDVNDRALELYGATREQLLTSTIANLPAPNTPIEQVFDIFERVRTGETVQFEWREQRFSDHTIFDSEVSLRQVTWGNRTVVIAGVRDISDRKQAERALQESQQFIQTVLDTVPIPMFWKNRDSVFLGCNQQFASVLGLASATGIIGKTDFDFSMTAEEAIAYQTDDRAVMESGEAKLGIEETITLASGEQRWLETHKAPLRDWASNIVGVVGMFKDITDRKQAEIALRESERRYATLAAVAPVAIFRFDEPLNCTYVSDYWSELTGRPIESALGRGWMEALHPDDRDLVLTEYVKEYIQLSSGNQSLIGGEGRHLRPDGSISWYYMQCAAEIDSEGNIVGYIGTLTDITARKQIESELAESEAKFRRLVEGSSDVILSLDTDGCFTYLSPQFKRLFGWEPDSLIGQPFGRFIHPSDTASLGDYKAFLESGRTTNCIEFRHFHRDGHYLWVSVNAAIVTNAEGQVIGTQGILSDISDRKQAQQALFESERRYATLTAAAPVGIYRTDSEGNCLYVNERWCQIAGLPAAAAKGMGWLRTLHADDRAMVAQAWEQSIQTGGTFRLEYRYQRPDGSISWVFGQAVQERDENGTIKGFVGTVTDISNRKRAEQELRESQKFLQTVIDTLPLAVFWKDRQSVYLGCNQKNAQTAGLSSPAEIIGKTDYDMPWAETEAELYRADDREVMNSGQARLSIIEPQLMADGSQLWIETSKLPLHNLQGEVVGVLGTYQDITDRKRAEQALRDSEERLRLALTASKQGLYDLNVKTGEAIVSPEYATMLGYDPATFQETNAKWIERLHPDDLESVAATYRDYIGGAIPDYTVEFRQRTQQGQWKWILSVGKIVAWDEAGQPLRMLGTHTDIDYRKQFEQKLRQINSELEQRVEERTSDLQHAMEAAQTASRAKSTFLANMSHELRTPLNAILGFTQLMSRDQNLEAEKRQQLGIINRSGKHLLSLINDILEMSKIEAGGISLNPVCFDLYALLSTLEEMFQLRAIEKGLGLVFDRAPAVPQHIETDENKLRQVLINLIGNAIKFTQKGSVTLRVAVEWQPESLAAWTPGKLDEQEPKLIGDSIGDQASDSKTNAPSLFASSPPLLLSFAVTDTGTGIDPGELDSLFEPFIQSQNGQSQEGTGLGLPISRQFVQLMGGDMTATSALGVGSTFAFSIPVSLADASTLTAPLQPRHILSLADNQPPHRILVVEDNDNNRQLLVQLLQSVGFEVQAAADGQQAIELWESWHPQLIWMDMRMPVLDGYAATQQIRALEAEEHSPSPTQSPTVIIALTASAFEEERAKVLDVGCNDFVRKPFQETELLEKITEFLDVQYRYAEVEPTDRIAPATPFDAIEALQCLPAAQLNQLHQATLQLDSDQLDALIEQMESEHPRLAALLAEKLDNFDLQQILDLLQEAMKIQGS